MPQARDLLVLELEDHKPSQWKQVFNQWEGNLLRHSVETLAIIVDSNYKLKYLEGTLGSRKKQIYLGWREWMKKNKLEELDNFDTNITVISFIDLIRHPKYICFSLLPKYFLNMLTYNLGLLLLLMPP